MNIKRPSLLLSEQILKSPFPQSPDSEDGLLWRCILSPVPPSLLFISLHDNKCESPGRPVKHISPCWVFFFFFLSVSPFPPHCQHITAAGTCSLVGPSIQKETAGECQRRLRHVNEAVSLSRVRPQFVCLFV